MVSVLERALPTFGKTVKATDPLPVPLAPDVNMIHEALVVAVHAQPFAADTFTEPDPPSAEIEALDGFIVYMHPDA